ncbi:SusC/RagA family TonB-linked outer membrane protein [Botryobacter ruber]|uniref:SusC/RagA family TonB-linked outer membrane protein n=1 Tax=Botryobacter ruber TaxID=2171629 RepID=UPI0013E29C27|nr:TonB-dependent receptor [Botryobacter ruber]
MKRFLFNSKWLVALGFMLPCSYGYAQQLADASSVKVYAKNQESPILLKDKKGGPLQQAPKPITVKGQVKDEATGESLPGVNILVKGTSQGAVSDVEGNYSLTVPNEDAVLVFKYIGYQDQEQKVGTRSVVNVSLKAGAAALEEVVVVGYGEQKRANLTGAVETLQAKEIEDLPVANLSEAIIGRMAGVRVATQNSGRPGVPTPLTIRRPTDKAPNPDIVTYVIDGVIYEDNGVEQFNLLDASEVESISILKDGAAAVYGARAGGGVVLVKTKRGGKGKPKVSYSTSLGVAQATQFPEMLSAREHALMLNEILDHEGRKYYVPEDVFNRYKNSPLIRFKYFSEDEIAAMDTLDYNWLDGLYKNGMTMRHTLNVSGGSDNIRYFVGGAYYSETGNIERLKYSRYSLRTNIEADITKDITFTLGVSTNRGTRNEPYFAGDPTLKGLYTRLLTAPRWAPPVVDGLPTAVDGGYNPYALLEADSYNNSTSSNTNLSGAFDYKVPFIKGLKARAFFSYNDANTRGKRYGQDVIAYALRRAGGASHLYANEFASNPERRQENDESMRESMDYSKFYQLNTSLTYNRTFGAHQIDALFVYEQREDENRNYHTTKKTANIKGYDQFWAFNDAGIVTGGNAAETGRLSYIGRLNYNYKGKYLLETAFRYEASQKFHPDFAWGAFPNVSAGWIITEENFFRDNINFINFLKIRASYGRTGTEPGRGFMWKQSYGANITGPLFGTGTTPNLTGAIDVKNEGIFYPTVTWQKNDMYNVGLDARVLNNKITVGFDAFYRNSFDILMPVNSVNPTTLGAPKPPQQNYGAAFSKGFELSLGHNNNIGNDFSYNVGGNISWNYGRPTKIPQNPAVIGRWDDQLLNDPSNQPGMIALGIIRTQEDLDRVLGMYSTIDGVPVEMGMIYYKDIRGENYSEGPDGEINQWDRTIIAERTSPAYAYGFTLGASWKNLRASATFSGAFGHKVFIQKDEMVLPTSNTNVFSFWNDYWTPDNPNASMPRPFNYGMADQISTFWMRDGHTLRLNNINVSYELPSKLTQRWKLPQFKVFYAGTNIWTVINPFDHKDPSVARAYEYPMVTTSNFGLNVTF